jgi:hydroxyethylthiazole kinase
MTAAFYAVAENGFDAAVAASAVAAIAGELGAEKAAGPGTFMPHFMDALYHMDQETLVKRLKAVD